MRRRNNRSRRRNNRRSGRNNRRKNNTRRGSSRNRSSAVADVAGITETTEEGITEREVAVVAGITEGVTVEKEQSCKGIRKCDGRTLQERPLPPRSSLPPRASLQSLHFALRGRHCSSSGHSSTTCIPVIVLPQPSSKSS